MDLSILRSKLLYNLPEHNFQNITLQDLRDFKWRLQRQIFISLLDAAPVLQSHSAQLFEVEEKRFVDIHTYPSS